MRKFDYQRFKARTLTHHLSFADAAALVATLEEAQEYLDRFSDACKVFVSIISLKKT